MHPLTGAAPAVRPRDGSLDTEQQQRLWRWRQELGRRLEVIRGDRELRQLCRTNPAVKWMDLRRIERGQRWRVPLLTICQAAQEYRVHPGPLLRDLDGKSFEIRPWLWSDSPEIPDLLVDKVRTSLRELREQADLSTTRLGLAVGLPQTSIVRLESGQTRLDAIQAEALAQALHTSLSQLLPEL